MERGAALPLAKMAELAEIWYEGRLEEGWRPRTTAEAQAVLQGLGLTGEFWQLPNS